MVLCANTRKILTLVPLTIFLASAKETEQDNFLWSSCIFITLDN